MQKIEVYLSLTGENLDPQKISEELGVQASSQHMKGDCLTYNPAAGFSQWCLSSGPIRDDSEDVYTISKTLVQGISSKRRQLAELKAKYNLEIILQVAISIDEEAESAYPPVGFDAATIDFLSSIGASIDVDINHNDM